ncbi:polyprenyl synthetase family protein [bacterium]|nr:polyprenyl synthetase family protein [bacterium]
MPVSTEPRTMIDFIEAQRGRIEVVLKKVLHHRETWPQALTDAAAHSLFAGGKRLRPVLALTVVEMLGRDYVKYENLFAALECIHTYSLIHDDLPAMDNDELRRGSPTCHKKFGEAAAILAGDGLLTLAFELLSEDSFVKNFQPEHVVQCIRHVSVAAGFSGMVGGQYYDIHGTGGARDEKQLLKIHAMKTARLLSASVAAPAVLSGVHEIILAKLVEYGDAIGLAFQICDDILNVVGSKENMGKPVGSDDGRETLTYPKVVGLDKSAAKARELCEQAKKAMEAFPAEKRQPFDLLAEFIIERVK